MSDHCAVHIHHEKEIARIAEKVDAFDLRVNGLELSISELKAKEEETERMITAMNTTQEKILAAVEALKSTGGKRWEQVVTTMLGAGVTALAVYLLKFFG